MHHSFSLGRHLLSSSDPFQEHENQSPPIQTGYREKIDYSQIQAEESDELKQGAESCPGYFPGYLGNAHGTYYLRSCFADNHANDLILKQDQSIYTLSCS